VAHDRTTVSGEFRLGEEPAVAAGAAVDAVDPGAGRAAGENFPVALRLLPASRRQYLMAVYGFARTADDIGDQAPPDQRARLLDELEADLRRLYAGRDGARGPGGPGSDGDPGDQSHTGTRARADGDGPPPTLGGDGAEPRSHVVGALGPAVTDCGIPMQPFLDLVQANRQDQVVSRYQTFEDLLGYCRLSANPVGRIVLYVFGSFSRQRAELSDSICTALQLAEHWQDVAEDLGAGRIYLPAQDMDTFGCTKQDLAQPSAPPQVRALIAFETRRARALLDAGAPLIGTLRGAARAAVAGYVAGGRAALAAIAAADHDVLRVTPRPRKRRVAAELALAYARGR
jgi:squalene synthase HpnC